MKGETIVAIVYFLFLYIIAWISARDIREDDAVLGVNRSQWEALLIMWLPSLIALAKN